jgi:hypothetical protein
MLLKILFPNCIYITEFCFHFLRCIAGTQRKDCLLADSITNNPGKTESADISVQGTSKSNDSDMAYVM